MALLSVPLKISEEPLDEPWEGLSSARPRSQWIHRMPKEGGSLATEALSMPASSLPGLSNYAFASWTVRNSLWSHSWLTPDWPPLKFGIHGFPGMLCKGLWHYFSKCQQQSTSEVCIPSKGGVGVGLLDSSHNHNLGIHPKLFWSGISSLCCYPRIYPMTFSLEVGPGLEQLWITMALSVKTVEPMSLSTHFLIFLHMGSFHIGFLWVTLTHPSDPGSNVTASGVPLSTLLHQARLRHTLISGYSSWCFT